MNNRNAFLNAALTALGLLLTVGAHAQNNAPNLPPPPPPIGPNAPPNQPLPPDVRVLPRGFGPTQVTAFPAATTSIFVDAAAKRHPISPLIYAVSAATPAQLDALNVPLFSKTRGAGLTDFGSVQASLPAEIFTSDASTNAQLRRNRATRYLWDPLYGATSRVTRTAAALIPLLKSHLSAYPPGTKAGIVSYSWGAENAMGGATAEADVLGIYGREGLDIASRPAPETSSPVFSAMQMYRSYDGKKSAFGDESVADSGFDPDTLSSFAAVRRADGALTIMIVNKSFVPAFILLVVSHFRDTGTAQVWQLAGGNKIVQGPSAAITTGHIAATLPAQSVTLFVVNRVSPLVFSSPSLF